jgi:membrane-associated protease RseP (regulator of RpoE activity)
LSCRVGDIPEWSTEESKGKPVMSGKCDHCGVESNLEEIFTKAHKSFSRSVHTYCPSCWLKQQHSDDKWFALVILGSGVLGLLFWFTGLETRISYFLINIFLFQIFLVLTIVPHELGHAWMARLTGMRVFKIYLGSGKTLFTFRMLGFDSELRTLPTGGVVVAAHRNLKRLRVNQFAFVLAGPVMNLLLAAVAWVFISPGALWSFQPLSHGFQPELAFFYANVMVLLENLWPRDVATIFGQIPTDGKQLFQAFFLSPEKRELHHAEGFVMEAAASHQQGDYQVARRWVEDGLNLYPDNMALLNWNGMIALGHGEYRTARHCFLTLLNRISQEPLTRAILLNNIAYANSFLGDEDLLKEADEFSLEAMAAMSWAPAIRGTRGAVLVAMGKFDEGLSLLRETMAQAEDPSHKAQNACLIAEGESRCGNISAARAYVEEARQLDPKCHLIPRVEAILGEARSLR